MEDAPLLLPVVIPYGQDIVSDACSKAVPTVLAVWDAATSHGHSAAISVAMGCQDGTIFLFHPEIVKAPSTESSSLDPKPHRTSPRPLGLSNLTRLHGPPSPSASSNHSSFLSTGTVSKHASFQPSKARVQAGISKEQVEAPKTYVDYENEASKLKSLLKSRDAQKERGFMESLLSIGHHRGSSSEGQHPKLSRHTSYSQNSTKHASSASTSPPASPTGNQSTRPIRSGDGNGAADPLKLVIHAFPPRFGQGRSVVQLIAMEEGTLLASLQECG
jgi:hypothetical protein